MPSPRLAYIEFLRNIDEEKRFLLTKRLALFALLANLIFHIHDLFYDHQRGILVLDLSMMVVFAILYGFASKRENQQFAAIALTILTTAWVFCNSMLYGRDSQIDTFLITAPLGIAFIVNPKQRVLLVTLILLPILADVNLKIWAYDYAFIEQIDHEFVRSTAILSVFTNLALIGIYIRTTILEKEKSDDALIAEHDKVIKFSEELKTLSEIANQTNAFLDKRVDEMVETLRAKDNQNQLDLIQNEETQRERIAKELHDSVGVLLSTAKLKMETLQGSNNDQAIQDSIEMLDQACQEVRSISHQMTPILFSKIGLVGILQDYQAIFNRNGSIEFELIIDNYNDELSREKELIVYRIITECVNNAIKHSECSTITVQLIARDKKLHLSVEDDGIGFDIFTVTNPFGIKSIKQRVKLIGAQFQFDSRIGEGTHYYIDIPLK